MGLQGSRTQVVIDKPSLIYFAKPAVHRFQVDQEQGADLVCASVGYGTGVSNPVTEVLPEYIIIPLEDQAHINNITAWLFEEAFDQENGRTIVMNKLCELLIIEIFRYLLARNIVKQGLFAGVNHASLYKVLQEIHDHPEKNWCLESLADIAAMSRSKFADTFKREIGQTPADYIADWRVSIAQKKLLAGQPIALIANAVGYDENSSFSRVFKRKTGLTPSAWIRKHQAGDE